MCIFGLYFVIWTAVKKNLKKTVEKFCDKIGMGGGGIVLVLVNSNAFQKCCDISNPHCYRGTEVEQEVEETRGNRL
jgi:hypothetical protein